MVSKSRQLQGDSEDLKVKLDRVDGDLNIELDAARRLEDESVQVNICATTVRPNSHRSLKLMFLQVSAGAAASLQQARQSRAAVDRTLREINQMFSQLSESKFAVTVLKQAKAKPFKSRSFLLMTVCFWRSRVILPRCLVLLRSDRCCGPEAPAADGSLSGWCSEECGAAPEALAQPRGGPRSCPETPPLWYQHRY